MADFWEDAWSFTKRTTGLGTVESILNNNPLGGGGKSNVTGMANAANKKKQELIDAINANPDIDAITKKEIIASGAADQASIDKIISDAKVGKGTYGIRKRNEELIRLLTDRPGSSQLFNSNQQRTDAQKGIISPSSSGMLLTGGKK